MELKPSEQLSAQDSYDPNRAAYEAAVKRFYVRNLNEQRPASTEGTDPVLQVPDSQSAGLHKVR